MGHDNSKYDKILKHYGDEHEEQQHPRAVKTVGPTAFDPKRVAFRTKLDRAREKLTDDCSHRILLDIYLHALPTDDGYAHDHAAHYRGDVDKMLSDQKCTASQYFRSSAAATKAPLLEYVNRSVDMIGKIFVEEAEAKAEADAEAGVETTDADLVPNEDVIDSQIVDIKSDTEYEDFIDKLKQKTIKRIVSDISSLISDKKDEKDMTFAPKTESAFCKGVDYLSSVVIKAGGEVDMSNDDVVDLVVREATLFTMNEVFAVGDRNLTNFANNLRANKGTVLTESAILDLCASYQMIEGYNPYSGYEKIMLENSVLLEQALDEIHTEGVADKIMAGAKAVGKGFKWLLDKIIKLCRNLKNMIKNAFKPNMAKIAAENASMVSLKKSALSKIGAKIETAPSIKPDKLSIGTVETVNKSIESVNKSIESVNRADGNSKATELAMASLNNVNIIVGDGSVMDAGYTIHFPSPVSITDTDRAMKNFEILLTSAKNGFTANDIKQLREIYGDSGLKYPIKTNTGFYIAGTIDAGYKFIDHLDRFLNHPAIRKLADDPNTDPYFGVLLRGIYSHMITINNEMMCFKSSSIKFSTCPFTADELAQIKTREDLGQVVEALLLDRKSFTKVFMMTKFLIINVSYQRGWISNDDEVPAGASRIVLLPKNGTDNIYKYAWNRKGIIDNKRDLAIKKVVAGTELEKLLALPTDESSNEGGYVVLPRATLVSSLPESSMDAFAKEFNEIAERNGIKIRCADHKSVDNYGKINGKLVSIDYGNYHMN